MIRRATILLLLCGLSAAALGQQRYYYKGLDYGSQALYNPISLVLNGSYDIIQLDGHDRDVARFPYGTASANVLRNLADPFGPISRYGVRDFLENEIFPIHLTKAGAQWWPNYQLHLIGGGMTFRAMNEWYDYHGFPSPGIFSIGTMAAYHLLNEFVENGAYVGDNVDPIADIYVFDIGGMLLFSSEGVSRWFSEELNLADWSMQPSFDLRDFTLQNNGQYFAIKWKIPYQERLHLFYYCGMNGLTGLAYKLDNGRAISVGAGLRAKNIVIVNAATNQQTMDLVWNGGIFYDRDNSLLASLTLNNLTDNAANLNVYPGFVRWGYFAPGVWLQARHDGALLFGLTTVWTPGVSVTSR